MPKTAEGYQVLICHPLNGQMTLHLQVELLLAVVWQALAFNGLLRHGMIIIIITNCGEEIDIFIEK